MSHTLTVEQNELTGECYIILPKALLDRMKWVEGDKILWKLQKDGSFLLIKKDNSKDKTTTKGGTKTHIINFNCNE
jgi:bifunctional DNA-binding transcriptional regulator/antitoxin component of YhaV-PrlF toxin-antitoxin module